MTNPNGGGASDAAAALKGANLAFKHQSNARAQPEPKPTAATNGALVAATSASRDPSLSRSPSRRTRNRLSRQTTGGSQQEGNSGGNAAVSRDQVGHEAVSQRLSQYLASAASPSSSHGHSHLHPPGRNVDPKSPSYIAATLAASRSASPSPRNASPGHGHGVGLGPPLHHGQRVLRKVSTGALSAAEESTTDTSSLAPARSLISMFDRENSDTDPVKRGDRAAARSRQEPRAKTQPLAQERGRSPDVVASPPSPTPRARLPTRPRPTTPVQRAGVATNEVASVARPKSEALGVAGERTRASANTTSVVLAQRPSTPPPRTVSRSQAEILSPVPRRISPRPSLFPAPPTPKRAEAAVSPKRSPAIENKASTTKTATATERSPKPPAGSRQRTLTGGTVSSDDTFVSANSGEAAGGGPPSPPARREAMKRPSSAITTRPDKPTPPRPRPQSRALIPARDNNGLQLESLTNAIVAGSLAASRLTPKPTSFTPPPALPKRQRSPRLRQTLRQPPSKSDDEDEGNYGDGGRRKHFGKLTATGKHAHHEGARRRWKEEMTERQRRRYEAVWASNRGQLLEDQGPAMADYVANVVVREIWRRSRLPEDELAEVWDLVDREKRGVLGRVEFVAGMWLIDQRLRGRKIPPKVSQSVWDSALGIRVLGSRKGR